MNENPFKKVNRPIAMEGRFIDKDGTDHGDADFHERQLGMTPEQEVADLEALREAIKKPTV